MHYFAKNFLLCAALFSSFSGSLLAENDSRAAIACYFTDGNNVSWQWALNSSNEFYYHPGDWIVTPHTDIRRFRTTIGDGRLASACRNAKNYHQETGTISSIFATSVSGDYNSHIILDGKILYVNF